MLPLNLQEVGTLVMRKRLVLTTLSSLLTAAAIGFGLPGCGGAEENVGMEDKPSFDISNLSEEEAAKKIESMRGGYAPPGVGVPKQKAQ